MRGSERFALKAIPGRTVERDLLGRRLFGSFLFETKLAFGQIGRPLLEVLIADTAFRALGSLRRHGCGLKRAISRQALPSRSNEMFEALRVARRAGYECDLPR